MKEAKLTSFLIYNIVLIHVSRIVNIGLSAGTFQFGIDTERVEVSVDERERERDRERESELCVRVFVLNVCVRL